MYLHIRIENLRTCHPQAMTSTDFIRFPTFSFLSEFPFQIFLIWSLWYRDQYPNVLCPFIRSLELEHISSHTTSISQYILGHSGRKREWKKKDHSSLELHRMVNPSNMNVFKYESNKNEKEKNRESNIYKDREREWVSEQERCQVTDDRRVSVAWKSSFVPFLPLEFLKCFKLTLAHFSCSFSVSSH